jgi:hypothetical protein
MIWTEITVRKYMTDKAICVEYRQMTGERAKERVHELAKALPGCCVEAKAHATTGTAVYGLTLAEDRTIAAQDTMYCARKAAKRLGYLKLYGGDPYGTRYS